MSTAAAEPPAATETTASEAPHDFGANFGEALAKAQGVEKPKAEAPAKPAVAEPSAKPPEQKKDQPAAKPKSALDALLGGEPPAKPVAAEAADDPLKDFPKGSKEYNMAKLREKAEEGWNKAKELEARLSAPDPKQAEELNGLRTSLKEREAAIEEMKARMAEYKDAMTAVNIELDPDYRREFIDGRKGLVESASKRFKDYGGNPEQLAEALAMPEGRRRDEALETLLSDVSDMGKSKITRAIADIEALDDKRSKLLANPQTSFEEYERKHSAARAAQTEQAEAVKKSTFEQVSRELAKAIPTLGLADETLEGGKEWNAARAKANESAMALLGDNLTPEQVVTASIKAADYDRVVTMFMNARKTLADQAARLAEFEGAGPTMRGRTAPKLTTDEERAKKTPGQLFADAMSAGEGGDI